MARILVLDTLKHPSNSGTANIVLSSDETTTMPAVNINGGQIDSTTIGASNPSTVAATTLTANTLDTGQGANELYDMDQNVKTDSTVSFGTISSATLGSSVTFPTGHLIDTKIYQKNTGIASTSVTGTTVTSLTDAITVACTSGNTYSVEFSGSISLGSDSANEDQYLGQGGLYEPSSAISKNSSSVGSARRYSSFGFRDIQGQNDEYGWWATQVVYSYSFTAGSTGNQYFVFAARADNGNIKIYLNANSGASPYRYVVSEYKGDNLYT